MSVHHFHCVHASGRAAEQPARRPGAALRGAGRAADRRGAAASRSSGGGARRGDVEPARRRDPSEDDLARGRAAHAAALAAERENFPAGGAYR